jgi:hypothetical protein
MRIIITLAILSTSCKEFNKKEKQVIAIQQSKDTIVNSLNIQFESVNNLDSLITEYPFLKKDLTDLSIPDPMGTVLLLARVKLGDDNFVFTRLEGPLYRGTEGSPVEVYLDRGGGYKHTLSVICNPEISIAYKPSLMLLITLNDGSQARWIYDESKHTFFTNEKNL